MRSASRHFWLQFRRAFTLAFAACLATDAPAAVKVCANACAAGDFQVANLQRDAEEVAEVAGSEESKLLRQYMTERSRRATSKSGS